MLQFSQAEIEGQLEDCFPYGTLREISIRTGIGETYLSQWLNQNDDRKSPTFQFLQIQCALDDFDVELGESHWQAVARFRDISKPDAGAPLCLRDEAAANDKESNDVTQKVLTDASLYEQLSEVDEQIRQAVRHKTALIAAINKEKTSTNGSNLRYATNGRAR